MSVLWWKDRLELPDLSGITIAYITVTCVLCENLASIALLNNDPS